MATKPEAKKAPAKKAATKKAATKKAAPPAKTLKPVIVKFNPLNAKRGDILFQVVMQED